MAASVHAFKFDQARGYGKGWNDAHLLVRGELTDRKIEAYRKKGFYSTQFRDSRRELMQRKAATLAQRDGGFRNEAGRLIYDPRG